MTDSDRSYHRLVDASLNRAAEGLRVAEDVLRFHSGLAGFAGELRELRHALLGAGRGGGPALRRQLRARDIEGDVGRAFGAPGPGKGPDPEARPEDLLHVAARNLERVREALRALEEVTRSRDPRLAGRFESIRYRLYSVEKGLAFLPREAAGSRARLEDARLYLLATEGLCRTSLEKTVGDALAAGVDIVQMREKKLAGRGLLERARRLREMTARSGALFVVNDRPDIALLSHADGVHVGQDDLPVAEARSIVGEELLIGVSTHTLEEARRAVREGADYIGVGPMFATRTKDAGPVLGPEGLAEIAPRVAIPFFAIGGITPDRVAPLLEAGARRLAVSAAILASDDLTATVRGLKSSLRGGGSGGAETDKGA
jgi:thiamine-phosphate pyrophosphorylase